MYICFENDFSIEDKLSSDRNTYGGNGNANGGGNSNNSALDEGDLCSRVIVTADSDGTLRLFLRTK
jgi:hypothetical protein